MKEQLGKAIAWGEAEQRKKEEAEELLRRDESERMEDWEGIQKGLYYYGYPRRRRHSGDGVGLVLRR